MCVHVCAVCKGKDRQWETQWEVNEKARYRTVVLVIVLVLVLLLPSAHPHHAWPTSTVHHRDEMQPPLPLVAVSIGMASGCQQNDRDELHRQDYWNLINDLNLLLLLLLLSPLFAPALLLLFSSSPPLPSSSLLPHLSLSLSLPRPPRPLFSSPACFEQPEMVGGLTHPAHAHHTHS